MEGPTSADRWREWVRRERRDEDVRREPERGLGSSFGSSMDGCGALEGFDENGGTCGRVSSVEGEGDRETSNVWSSEPGVGGGSLGMEACRGVYLSFRAVLHLCEMENPPSSHQRTEKSGKQQQRAR